MAKEELIIRIGADAKRYRKALKGIQDQTQDLEDQLTAIAKVSGAAFVAFGAGILGASKSAADFEAGLISVQKTTGLSDEKIEQLGETIQKLSVETGKTTSSLLEISTAVGQVGQFSVGQIEKIVEVFAKLETATDLSGEGAVKAITRLLRISGDGIDDIENFGNAIVKLGNDFAASESEILATASEVGRSVSAFKIGSANVLGLATALKETDQRSQISGSAIGRVFRAIDESVRGGGKSFRNLQVITGLTAEELRKNLKEDANATFRAFISGLQDIDRQGDSVAETLELFKLKGDEINKVVPVLALNTDRLKLAQEVANRQFKNGTALQDEFQAAMQGASAQVSQATSAIRIIAENIGKQFLPAIKSAASAVVDFLAPLAFDKEFTKFAAATLAVGAAITGIVTALSVAGIAMLKFQGVLLATNGFLGLLKMGFSTFVAPVRLLISGIGMLFNQFMSLFGLIPRVGMAVVSLGDNIIKLAFAITKNLVSALLTGGKALQTMGSVFVGFIKSMAGGIPAMLKFGRTMALSAILNLKIFATELGKGSSAMGRFVLSLFNGVSGATTFASAVKTRVLTALSSMILSFKGALLASRTFFINLLTQGPRAFIPLLAGAKASILALGKMVVGLFTGKTAMGAFAAATRIAGVAVKGLVGATGIGLLIVLISEVVSRVQNWGAAIDLVQNIFSNFFKFIKAIAGPLGKLIEGIFDLDLSKIKEGVAEAKGIIVEQFKFIAKQAGEDFDKIFTAQEDYQDKSLDSMRDSEDKKTSAMKKGSAERIQAQLDEFMKRQEQGEEFTEKQQEYLNRLKELQAEHDEIMAITDEEERAKRLEKFDEETQQLLEKFRERKELERELKFETAEEDRLLEQELAMLSNEERAALDQEDINNLKSGLQTRKKLLKDFAIERINEQRKANKEFFKNEMKFGTAYAMLQKTLQSEQVQGFKTFATEMQQLQQSNSDKLKAIGKAAAIANTTIEIASSIGTLVRSIQQAVPFPASIPVIAGAVAARVALGAEQISKIQGAADGGLLRGGTPGVDSIPLMAQDMELIAPPRSFDEVVEGTARMRGFVKPSETSGGGFDESAIEILQEIRDSLVNQEGDTFQGIVDEEVIGDSIITLINNRLESGNAELIQSARSGGA